MSEGLLYKKIQNKVEIMTATLIDDVGGTSEEVPMGIRGIKEVLDEAKRKFPTVDMAEAKAKEYYPKKNWKKLTCETRSMLQSYLLMLIADWFEEAFGEREYESNKV